ncbi:MAG: CoA-transferase subunit beta [Terriglobia bacterium]
MAEFTRSELMVAAAAREIRDGDIVFVGMRLPLIAFVVAKNTHAPNAVGVFENGVLRSTPARDLLFTMSDGPNITGALSCLSMLECMALLQQGRVSLGFLGAAEVDRAGNLNSTEVRGSAGKPVRLPGSGGACDITALAQRFVALLDHQKERLPERVHYITSPGYGPWRAAGRLQQGGPAAVITTKAVLRFGPHPQIAQIPPRKDLPGEAYLESYHPGVSVEEILANTGWPLLVSPDVRETPAPTRKELRVIRSYDPQGFWTK